MNWTRSFAVLVLLMATPAIAQMYPLAPYSPDPGYPRTISPGQVMAAVQSAGLRPVSDPRLRGSVWSVSAIDRDGELVRAVVDSQSGRIINITALSDSEPSEIMPRGSEPRMAMRGPHYEDMYEDEEPEYRVRQPMPPYGSNQPPYSAQALPDDEVDQPIGQLDGRPFPPPNSSSNGPQFSRQTSAPKNVDPLLGVPPEFRGKNARIESKLTEKPVASKPTSAPLPKARPVEAKKDDGPAVAMGSTGLVSPNGKKD